jgi:predicted methyltransferase
MKNATLLALALGAALAGCGPEAPDPVVPPSPAPPPPVETAVVAPPAEPPKPPEPTPEEKKKAEEAKQLAADRAQFEIDLKAETARWTPDLHAEAQKVAGAKYGTLKGALTPAIKAHYRKPGDADRDRYRHPAETLAFLGITPTMTVLEYGPGEGWYTELLAPALALRGKLVITSGDPNGPPDARGTFYAERTKRLLEVAPELYGKVDRMVVDSKTPHIDGEGKFDAILLFRELHGLHQNKLVSAVLAEAFKALKPGGILGVEQHRAPDGANADESAKKGYLPQAWVIAQAEAAGFKLAGKSEINANAKDTKDYPEGVWTLPPSFRLKDKDRQKYADIGESDRMTLKFVKPKK